LAANPILEAFGNAKTVRNDNSSRFGKFMEIHFATEGRCQIKGCHTINYLLEKSRVVAQAPGERNFHIFHYLLNQFTKEQKVAFMVDRPEETFLYLSADGSPCALADQHNDVAECSKLQQALEEMGFSQQEKDGMFRVVAAILHLGNVQFDEFESTGSKITTGESEDALKAFCELTGTDITNVATSLTMMISQQRDGLLARPFNPQVATDARNALSRHLYNRLFEWIVARVNATLTGSGITAKTRSARDLSNTAVKTNFIGMLDIFGFEIFETNSFEQLCINFANEKLQQMFNRHTFTLEEETYIREGVPFDKIAFHDSQPLLSFLGLAAPGSPLVRDGVFQLLDEQTTINGTDEKFLLSVSSRHDDKRKLFSDRVKSRSAFKVFHYAGDVEYETGGFVVKNADKLYENIESAMSNSKVFLFQTMFKPIPSLVGSRNSSKTQASTFMKQLVQLEDRTNATFPRYIRCVKPNQQKLPGVFDPVISLEQLRFAGVFEAVSIRKRGYPFRRTHEQFFYMYSCVVPNAVTKAEFDAARKHNSFGSVSHKVLDAICRGPVPNAKDCHAGKTMVLYRAEQHRSLEIQRLGVLNQCAATIQKRIRGMYVRNRVPELKRVRDLLRVAIQARVSKALESALNESAPLFFKTKEAYDADAVLQVLKLESSLAPKIQTLVEKSSAGVGASRFDVAKDIDSLCSEMSKYMKRDKKAFVDQPGAMLLFARHKLFEFHNVKKDQLKQSLARLHNSNASDILSSLTTETQQVLQELDALASDAGESIETASVPLKLLLEQSQEAIAGLNAEINSINIAAQAAAACVLKGSKGELDISGCKSNLPMLTETLKNCPNALSADVRQALENLQLMSRLYAALVVAIEVAEHADDPEWLAVEALVGEGQGLLSLSRSNAFFEIPQHELSLVVAELTLRAEVDTVVQKLELNLTAVDDEPLSTTLQQAHSLDLLNHHDEHVRSMVQEGDRLLPLIQDARRKLQAGIASVDEAQLQDALYWQSQCLFGENPGMVGFETVQSARQLYSWVCELTSCARVAVNALEVEPTKFIVDGCDEIGLNIDELVPLREFLHLPKDRQLLQQRDAAVQLQNYRRAIEVSIAHKTLFFESHENRENFSLEHFPKLKTPEEFAKRFGITFSKYKGNMLHWYNPMFGKIHTSLTTIEPTTGNDAHGKPIYKTATLLFKNVFGVMGDKIYENVDGLALELLTTGIATHLLRDEIFCQVMKQVTENPKPESEARGWNLMSMLLAAFPPSQSLENYLELFLRKSNKMTCVKVLHASLLCGPLLSPPSLSEVSLCRSTSGNMDIWFNGERRQLQLRKSDLDAPPQPDQVARDWRGASYDSPYDPPPPPDDDDEMYEQPVHEKPPPPPPKRSNVSRDEEAPPPPPVPPVAPRQSAPPIPPHQNPPPMRRQNDGPPPPLPSRTSNYNNLDDEDDIL